MGGFLGDLKDAPAHALGARAISAAVERAGIAADSVDEILMGCVLPAGQGQAPARQAAIGAGLPLAAGATTINKMCGSGMKAAMVAHDLLRAGSADVVVAGGMESMSNAPYLLDRARSGYRMGHGRTLDHMFLDGLEDAYDKGRLMGTFAEDCAEAYQFTRAAQDAYALTSLERANRAISNGDFAWEIAPVSVKARQGRDGRRDGRAAPKGEAGQDPDAQARLPRRRHGDGGQFELDLRRRGRAHHDARKRSRKARRDAACASCRACDPRRRAEGFPHRSDRRAQKAVREDRLEPGFRRSVRDQRGVRRRRHGGDARSRACRTRRST